VAAIQWSAIWYYNEHGVNRFLDMGSEFRVAFQSCLRVTSTAAMTLDSPRLNRATARSKPAEEACHISGYWKKVRICHGVGTCFLPESTTLHVMAPISLSDVCVPVHCHYCENEGVNIVW
jgi:hypothetical protein